MVTLLSTQVALQLFQWWLELMLFENNPLTDCLLLFDNSDMKTKTNKARPCISGSGCRWCSDGVEIFGCQALGPFPPTERLLNVTAHLIIAADQVREILTTVNPHLELLPAG